MSAEPRADQPVSSEGFETFLAEVEAGVSDAAQALLYCGGQRRLEITLLKHERNPRVIWGLKGHEDWAFKATLLRFARGAEPAHLVLAKEHGGAPRVQGWRVCRTMDAFQARPLSAEQAEAFAGATSLALA